MDNSEYFKREWAPPAHNPADRYDRNYPSDANDDSHWDDPYYWHWWHWFWFFFDVYPPSWVDPPDSIDDKWSYITDNDFAREFLQVTQSDTLPQQLAFSQLCGNCTNTASQDFRRNVTPSLLRKIADSCSLCGMLWKCLDLEKSSSNNDEEFELYRRGSMLMRRTRSMLMWDDGLPVFRICMGQGIGSEAALADIQVGFPMLPEAGSLIHFKLLREWLRVCDKDHPCHPRSDSPLPTRVLDVGDHENPDSLRLYCTTKGERGRYLALSHCWGKLEESQKFCTYRRNIAALRKTIDFGKLPKTFQDAVTVTRGLGERFLWIDSLCIIQGDTRDWDKESRKMETVFGSAYCTIAASSAKDCTEGFLSPRSPIQCVKVPYTSDTSLYICENIDNFHRDVEEGELNKRAWVLQERALSRRTIHFTTEQTYWECGEGVHCESLIKMQNARARLLGDPHFPKFTSNTGNRARIVLFQDLFEMYSKLTLSHLTDKPVAISGLERRFASAFNTQGYYGIFQRYLHRSILWQRSGDRMELTNPTPDMPVDPINHQLGLPYHKVPSWSWMAYNGGISYMDIPFEDIEWSSAVKFFPDKLELQAPVREFLYCTIKPQNQTTKCVIFAEGDERGWLKFDMADMTDIQRLKCVIVGRARRSAIGRALGRVGRADEQVHYVLVVTRSNEKQSEEGHGTYERVGVGTIQRRHISFQGGEFKARIV